MVAHTALGFFAALLATVLFGSNFVVVKEYDMGDGIYFQFIFACGIWVTGLVTVIVKCIASSSPTYFFHPLAITSGIIWSCGNILTVPIIKTIGMGLGISIWCAAQLIVGWSTGKWGLLGTPKDTSVKHEGLNYAGVALVFVSLILFFKVKPDNVEDDVIDDHSKAYFERGDSQNFHIPRSKPHVFNPNSMDKKKHNKAINSPTGSNSFHTITSKQRSLIEETSKSDMRYERIEEQKMVSSWVDNLSVAQRNLVGGGCSVIAGICYGVMFCPVQSIINKHGDESSDYSNSMVDYVFIVYNGIFVSALFYFIVYCIYKKNKPQINARAAMPSIFAGVIWAIAMDSYFVALDKNNLGVETTFPIVSAGPQVVSSLWGVLYYKEVKGRRNITYLAAAILMSICSVFLVSLSKF